jgi:thiamine-monophosphate kinase
MPLSEFALIDRFFRDCGARRGDALVGVGDDAALLRCAPGRELVAAIDTLVEGVHFPAEAPAASLGHRVLAVNLSDLAAMGAEPAWALLALTLPRSEERWLGEFAESLCTLARAHNVQLVGGDTTSGPLSATVQVLGFVEPGTALLRSGGRAGDALFVTGTPGDAAAGLQLMQSRLAVADAQCAAQLRERFLFPTPRVALGRRLRAYASACIDVSDGLLGDADKLARASGCGAELDYAELPVSAALLRACGEARARELALIGGDDYELCFSVPPARIGALLEGLPQAQWGYRRIGALRSVPETVVRRGQTVMDFSHRGFDHFA